MSHPVGDRQRSKEQKRDPLDYVDREINYRGANYMNAGIPGPVFMALIAVISAYGISWIAFM